MNTLGFYSPDYFTARSRFVAASRILGFRHQTLEISAPSPTNESLTIDVAVAGSHHPTSVLVLSSGIHGVEAAFGSAVQLAFMDSLPPGWRPRDGAAVILLHTLNPYGFAWRRRFNEDNVDLNRNFLLADEKYAGSPPRAAFFRRMLTPASFHRRFGLWTARMALLAMRHGLGSFWQTLPVGQYDYPDWLFFGGHARSQTAEQLDRLLPSLVGNAEVALHLDFHTGLGPWAKCQLLLGEQEAADSLAWWREHFHDSFIRKSVNAENSYSIRGGFGQWLQWRFPHCAYRYAVAEFGTYSPRHIIGVLSEELRWHVSPKKPTPDHWSRVRLAEAFVPRDPTWRSKALTTGLSLIERATKTLWSQAAAGSA